MHLFFFPASHNWGGGDSVSVFVSESFLNFLLYFSCGSLIVQKYIFLHICEFVQIFHLLTCSFKPLLFCKSPLLNPPPHSPLKFLLSLAFWGKFIIALTEPLTYVYLATTWFCFIIVVQMSCGEISRCLQLEPYFAAWLYNSWKERLCLLSLFLTSF